MPEFNNRYSFRKPEHQTVEEKLILQIVDQHFNELTRWTKEYEEYDEGLRYLAGDQYVKEDQEWWELQKRAARTYNHMLPIYNSVLGDFLTNDQRARVFPLPGGILETSTALEKLMTHFNEENDYKWVFGTWGLHGIIKRGYAYPRFSDEKFIDGSLVFTPMDQFEVGFDSRSLNYFLDDAWYTWRGRWETYHDIIARAPRNKREQIKQFLEDKRHDGFWDGIEDDKVNKALSNTQYVNEKEGKYFVLEWHRMEYDSAVVALDPLTGASDILDFKGTGSVIDKKLALYRKINPRVITIEKEFQKKKKICEIIPGMMTAINSWDAEIQDGTFDFVPFSAYHYARRTIDFFGIHRNAKDPQLGFNEWENTAENIAKKIADPGQIWRPEAIINVDSVRNFGNSARANIEVNSDTNVSLDQVYKTKEPPAWPFTSNDMAIRKLDFLQKVTGITPNMFGGEQTKQENASLFAQRVRQAKQTLEVIYHNWARSKRRLYNKCIRIVQENYTEQKIFWITQKNPLNGNIDPVQFIVNQKVGQRILNDLSIGRYRAVVEELDSSQSAKAIRFVERVQIAEIVFKNYGARVPIEWLLGESVDLGDMDMVIKSVQEQLQQQAMQQQKMSALGTTGALQQLAQNQMNLQNPAGAESQIQPSKTGS